MGAVPSGDSSFWGPLLLGTTPFGDRFIYLMIQIENSFPFACTNGRPTYRTKFLTHVFFHSFIRMVGPHNANLRNSFCVLSPEAP